MNCEDCLLKFLVCGFEAFINGKHIIGEVKEKEEAHKEYKKAISEGHGAYLMDEETPVSIEMAAIIILAKVMHGYSDSGCHNDGKVVVLQLMMIMVMVNFKINSRLSRFDISSQQACTANL